MSDPARQAALDVLREVAASDAYANLVLPPLLRTRRIAGRDAAFATELAYGTLRLRGRYDAVIAASSARPLDQIDPLVLDVLRLGAHQLLGMRVPAHAAVSETVELAPPQARGFVNAVLRRVSELDTAQWLADLAKAEPDATERLAVTTSHPGWIVRALRGALRHDGREDELEALLEADNTAPQVTLVVRPGLAERTEVAGRDDAAGHKHVAEGDEVMAPAAGAASAAGRWAPTAIRSPGGDPGAIPAVQEGRIGIQDEGSQLVALALAAVPVEGRDEEWLDLCAGPGGKAALLGALAAQRGARLVANEVQPHRVDLVRRAVTAIPDGVVEVRRGDGREVAGQFAGHFDRVLVDAPCTGLGALRRRPESRWRRQPGDLAVLGELQRQLLEAALAAIRPGGVVAYVTCSPHLAETNLVVEDVLRGRDDVVRLDAAEALRSVAPDLPLTDRLDAQLWPHVHGTDAMYLALLQVRVPV